VFAGFNAQRNISERGPLAANYRYIFKFEQWGHALV
jgi:hypothetical protein